MNDFDELLARTSLGAPGVDELIAAVPDRVVGRAMKEAETERVKQDDLRIEQMRIEQMRIDQETPSVHSFACRLPLTATATGEAAYSTAIVTLGFDGRELPEQFPTEPDTRLKAPPASAADQDDDDEESGAEESGAANRQVVVPNTHARVELRDLAALAGTGDQTALNDLLTRVRSVAHRYVRSRLWAYPGGKDMVDDVAQEVCVAVFGALGRYKDEGRPFEGFVYGIAARKVADAQRGFAVADVSTANPPDSADDGPTPEEQAVRQDETQQVLGLLDNLPTHLQEILRLRVISGMSAEETGKALGMTPGKVRVEQHRALNTLRGLVGQEPDKYWPIARR